jgi:hypothetical protein
MGRKRGSRYDFEMRYIRTSVVDIGVCRHRYKGEMYKEAFKNGWGALDTDKDGARYCDEDTSVEWWDKDGKGGCIGAGERVERGTVPKQADLAAVIVTGSGGWSFWAQDMSWITFFGTLDENSLFESFRLDRWDGKPFDGDGEIEVKWEQLDTEEIVNLFKRHTVIGTAEHDRLHDQTAT